jgi:hypothetical protein
VPPYHQVCFNRIVAEPFNVIVQVEFFFQKLMIDPPLLGVQSSRPGAKQIIHHQNGCFRVERAMVKHKSFGPVDNS